MIPALLKNDDFVTDVQATQVGDGFAIWWLGQSGFLLKHPTGYVLFDPYLSESLTVKYAGSDKPHTRLTERVVDAAQLSFVDIVTSTHNHTDHLDADTLRPLLAKNPNLKLVIPEANRDVAAERLACKHDAPVGLSDGEHVELGDVTFHAVPAAHETIDRDEQGRSRFLGYIVKFGRWSIYHSGDTVWFDGLEALLKPFNIDVAMMPINGRTPERRVAGNLWGDQTADLAQQAGIKMVVPCHYHMFAFNTETPDLFVHRCQQIGQPYTVL
ncbi:MAG: MBL fold metallo-hydrolase, partial [Phycisphaeraceae bacterium]